MYLGLCIDFKDFKIRFGGKASRGLEANYSSVAVRFLEIRNIKVLIETVQIPIHKNKIDPIHIKEERNVQILKALFYMAGMGPRNTIDWDLFNMSKILKQFP